MAKIDISYNDMQAIRAWYRGFLLHYADQAPPPPGVPVTYAAAANEAIMNKLTAAFRLQPVAADQVAQTKPQANAPVKAKPKAAKPSAKAKPKVKPKAPSNG